MLQRARRHRRVYEEGGREGGREGERESETCSRLTYDLNTHKNRYLGFTLLVTCRLTERSWDVRVS